MAHPNTGQGFAFLDKFRRKKVPTKLRVPSPTQSVGDYGYQNDSSNQREYGRDHIPPCGTVDHSIPGVTKVTDSQEAAQLYGGVLVVDHHMKKTIPKVVTVPEPLMDSNQAAQVYGGISIVDKE